MVSLAVWLFAGLQERQVSQFIEEKQQTILAKGKGKIQEGNIDTTHVVAALPTDDAGHVLGPVESRMISYVQRRFGHKTSRKNSKPGLCFINRGKNKF